MDGSIIELSQYRLERAKEDFETAEANLKDGRLKASLNRSYYAIFHALRAVTILSGFDSSKHSGIISYFNRCYVKTGIFVGDLSELIKDASRMREKSDYQDFFIVSRSDVERQIDDARRILADIEIYLNAQWKAGITEDSSEQAEYR